MGLLNGDFDISDPKTIGLLSAAAAMFDRSGPSTTPHSLGQILGGGLSGGLQGYQGAKLAQQTEEMKQMDLAQKKLAMQQALQKMNYLKQIAGDDGGGAVAGQPAIRAPQASSFPLGSGFNGMAPSQPSDDQQAIQGKPSGGSNAGKLNGMMGLALMDNKIGDAYNIMKDMQTGYGRDANKYYIDPVTKKQTYMPDPSKGLAFDPETQTVKPLNGFNESNAAMKGAETTAVARANAGYDLLPLGYVAPDGRPIGGSKLPYIEGQQQQPMPPQSAQPQRAPLQNSGFPAGVQVPQQNQIARMGNHGESDMLTILRSERATLTNPADIAAIDREIARAGGSAQPQMQQVQAPAAQNGRPILQSQAEKQAIEDAAKIQTQSTLGRIGVSNAVDEALAKTHPDVVKQRQSAIDKATDSLAIIDKAINHPGLSTATGLQGTIDPRNYIPGTDAKNFQVLSDQIKGGAFLQAFETLKGGGQITEIEGKKATDAIARLNTVQSTAEYKTALNDLKDVLNVGIARTKSAPYPLDIARQKLSGEEKSQGQQSQTQQVQAPKWQDHYASTDAAIRDAKNAIFKNPSARAAIIQRLNDAGITNHGLR